MPLVVVHDDSFRTINFIFLTALRVSGYLSFVLLSKRSLWVSAFVNIQNGRNHWVQGRLITEALTSRSMALHRYMLYFELIYFG